MPSLANALNAEETPRVFYDSSDSSPATNSASPPYEQPATSHYEEISEPSYPSEATPADAVEQLASLDQYLGATEEEQDQGACQNVYQESLVESTVSNEPVYATISSPVVTFASDPITEVDVDSIPTAFTTSETTSMQTEQTDVSVPAVVVEEAPAKRVFKNIRTTWGKESSASAEKPVVVAQKTKTAAVMQIAPAITTNTVCSACSCI